MHIKTWMVKWALFAPFCLIAAVPLARAGDDYNFNWLDPDKKIYVLQNRRYVKAEHLLISGSGGYLLNNAYLKSYSAEGRAAFYILEALGVEVFYTKFFNSENQLIDALKTSAPTALPFVRRINAQYGGLIHWVPWYAKLNVFNQIMYFDWYFAGGAGSIDAAVDKRANLMAASNLVGEKLLGLYLATGHQYHINQHFVVRLDFTGAFYNATYDKKIAEKTWFSNLNCTIGAGFRL